VGIATVLFDELLVFGRWIPFDHTSQRSKVKVKAQLVKQVELSQHSNSPPQFKTGSLVLQVCWVRIGSTAVVSSSSFKVNSQAGRAGGARSSPSQFKLG
jgi:hypothetical protein